MMSIQEYQATLEKAIETKDVSLLAPLVETIPVYKKKRYSTKDGASHMVQVGKLTTKNELIFLEPKKEPNTISLGMYDDGFWVEGRTEFIPEEIRNIFPQPEGFHKIYPKNINTIFEVTDTSSYVFSIGYMIRDNKIENSAVIFYDQYLGE